MESYLQALQVLVQALHTLLEQRDLCRFFNKFHFQIAFAARETLNLTVFPENLLENEKLRHLLIRVLILVLGA